MAHRLRLNQAMVKSHSHHLAWNHVTLTTLRMEAMAKADAPVRKPNENGRLGGRLRASIGRTMGGTMTQVDGRVGSNLDYAAAANSGAEFHIIRAKRKQVLSFKWDKGPAYIPRTRGGRYDGHVAFKFVRHPGMDGNGYLTRALRVVGRGMGYRVVSRALWSDLS